jgi:hypothetical protein
MRNLSVLLLALGLAACGSDRKDEGAGKAEGQILPASASDAMLPLDTLRSQAPLAPQTEGESKTGTDAAATATEAGEVPAAEASVAPPEPAKAVKPE